MPRIPRFLFPDGLFHVTARGVAKMPIYHDNNDRRNFLSLLAFAVDRHEWTCQAFCLMTNHYHLVLDATRENLSDGMQILNGDYALGFNFRYGRWGHVFGDRCWCRSVEPEELQQVCLYVMGTPSEQVSAMTSRTGPGVPAGSSSA